MPKDLQLCEETAAGVDSHGQFQFADLVTLDAQTTGVIVQIQREHFQVGSGSGHHLVLPSPAITSAITCFHLIRLLITCS